MAKQRQQQEALPCPYSEDDFRRMEEALRSLAVTKQLIERCKRCKIPVQEAEADCDAQTAWFQAILAEFRGPQSPIPA